MGAMTSHDESAAGVGARRKDRSGRGAARKKLMQLQVRKTGV